MWCLSSFCVYNESNIDLCLHRELCLTKIHHQTAKCYVLYGEKVKNLGKEVAYGSFFRSDGAT